MGNEIVNYYENYREEDRITTNHVRRIVDKCFIL